MQKARKPTDRCVFCGRSGDLSKEHIWSDWLDQVIPRGGDRYESVVGVHDHLGNPLKDNPPRRRQGAVHTKKVRCVCKRCNNGWMSQIVQAAKPIAARLIKGEQTVLMQGEQQALATWISLSAMMANWLSKERHKIAKVDRSYMDVQHVAPPHWYIGIGYYYGPEPVGFNQNHYVAELRVLKTGAHVVGSKFNIHVIATILGRLFTLCQVSGRSGKPLDVPPPFKVYRPWLEAIWPRVAPLPFPPPPELYITGSLYPDGGLARDLATRFITRLNVDMMEYGLEML